MRLLDRYVTRTFLGAYVFCLAGFLSIWLTYDISDNISTFIEDRVGLHRTAEYYMSQLPQIFVLLFPFALLLALLFALGRMSRSNEIVSMLTAGVSILRILLPLVAIGVLTTAASMALNYSWAPQGESKGKAILALGKNPKRATIEGQIFRNRRDARTWFIQRIKPGATEFENVQILQENDREQITTNYLASRARYRKDTGAWDLEEVKIVRYDAEGNIQQEELLPVFRITDWSETPFRLSSANMRAELLAVPELVDYLHLNSDFPETLLAPFKTHWHYRFALPWACLVVVLIAAPLGIGFSRRSVVTSVATAIILVCVMNFLAHFFLALGEGARIPPAAAAWTPIVLFSAIGLGIFYSRVSLGWPRFSHSTARRIVKG